jgi:hypothetical protein
LSYGSLELAALDFGMWSSDGVLVLTWPDD